VTSVAATSRPTWARVHWAVTRNLSTASQTVWASMRTRILLSSTRMARSSASTLDVVEVEPPPRRPLTTPSSNATLLRANSRRPTDTRSILVASSQHPREDAAIMSRGNRACRTRMLRGCSDLCRARGTWRTTRHTEKRAAVYTSRRRRAV